MGLFGYSISNAKERNFFTMLYQNFKLPSISPLPPKCFAVLK